MLEDGPATCEQCGGALRRVLHPAGIIFRGSGFYATDSRSSKESSTPAAAEGKNSKEKTETASSGSGSNSGPDD